jgi:hypothetical protein
MVVGESPTYRSHVKCAEIGGAPFPTGAAVVY